MKKILVSALILTSFTGTGVFGSQVTHAATKTTTDTTMDIVPCVNWSGNSYLTTSAYSNVTSSNNIFRDSPKVTNDSSNKGDIKVKIVNAKGAQVGSVKTVKKGQSVRMDQIPALSGTYTLKAKAVSKSGTYLISID